jgi:hypothetical protein
VVEKSALTKQRLQAPSRYFDITFNMGFFAKAPEGAFTEKGAFNEQFTNA